MTSAPFMLVPLILVTAVSSGYAAKLPDSAERLLLGRLHAQKIIAVHDVRRRTIDGFDYLGVSATFEVTSVFESWYHPEVILRKTRTEADWTQAELFTFDNGCPISLPHLMHSSRKLLSHGRAISPNQSMKPTAGPTYYKS